MKTKVIATILGMVFCAALLCATDVIAAPGWYNCTINRVGPGLNAIYINVTHTADPPVFTWKWCVLSENMKNQRLAVSLTAMANDQSVAIYIDPLVNYPTVTAIYLIK